MTVKPFSLSVRTVIFDQHGRILILKRSSQSAGNPGKWELPGGKINTGESFDSALKRAINEETGFETAIYSAAGTAMQETEEERIVHLVMIGAIISGGLAISKEYEEYRWATPIEIGGVEKADWFDEYYRVYLQGAIPTSEKEGSPQ